MSDFQDIQLAIENSPYYRQAERDPNKTLAYVCMEKFLPIPAKYLEDAVTHGGNDGNISGLHIELEGPEEGTYIVFCDWADSKLQALRPVPKKRLERFVQTWLAIASSRDDELELSYKLRAKIPLLHRYWRQLDSGYIPHYFYFFTNRKLAGYPRRKLERRLNYFMTHSYFYHAQKDLAEVLVPSAET